jgi:hypothetical protein
MDEYLSTRAKLPKGNPRTRACRVGLAYWIVQKNARITGKMPGKRNSTNSNGIY